MKTRAYFKKAIYPLLGLILFTFFISACKKDTVANNTGNYEMTFNANGTQIKYNTDNAVVATFSQTGEQYVGIFSGYDANSNMGLSVYDNKQISESDYTGFTASGMATVGALIGYQDDSGTLYSQAGNDVDIKISSITSDSVSGTFSGTLTATGKPNMVITEGKFTLKRLN